MWSRGPHSFLSSIRLEIQLVTNSASKKMSFSKKLAYLRPATMVLDRAAKSLGYNDQSEVLAQARVDAIEARYRSESWTTSDLYAAFLQSSLLSYKSAADSGRLYGVDRYVNNTLEMYAHNCPWNDWTPPSQSLQLFNAAAVNKKTEDILQRVRVRLCNDMRPESPTLIVFASVEADAKGVKCLRFRRGAEVLASTSVAALEATVIGACHMMLSHNKPGRAQHAKDQCRLKTRAVRLRFEDDRRLAKFCDMLWAA